MPVPLKLLFVAAELAQNEKAQRAAKAVWDAGTGIVAKRQAGQKALPTVLPEVAAPAAPKRRLKEALARRLKFRRGNSGDLIRFTYTDEHGLATERMVGNWQCRGGEVVGYCLNRKEEMAFAISGISNWEEIPVGRAGRT